MSRTTLVSNKLDTLFNEYRLSFWGIHRGGLDLVTPLEEEAECAERSRLPSVLGKDVDPLSTIMSVALL